MENSLKLNKIKSERKGERQLEKKNGTSNKGESVRVSGRTNERTKERERQPKHKLTQKFVYGNLHLKSKQSKISIISLMNEE